MSTLSQKMQDAFSKRSERKWGQTFAMEPGTLLEWWSLFLIMDLMELSTVWGHLLLLSFKGGFVSSS